MPVSTGTGLGLLNTNQIITLILDDRSTIIPQQLRKNEGRNQEAFLTKEATVW